MAEFASGARAWLRTAPNELVEASGELHGHLSSFGHFAWAECPACLFAAARAKVSGCAAFAIEQAWGTLRTPGAQVQLQLSWLPPCGGGGGARIRAAAEAQGPAYRAYLGPSGGLRMTRPGEGGS